MSTKITILVDNTASGALLGEHGLSMLVEVGDSKILFDAGQGVAFEENVKRLGIDLTSLTHFAFSHGHYDHTGGIATLAAIPEHADFTPRIHMHPAALDSKFAEEPDGSAKQIGISPENCEWLLSRGDSLLLSCEFVEIAAGVHATGEIPLLFPEEVVSSRFRLDVELTRLDGMMDDLALFMETGSGIVVLLGCCHRGLANTLRQVANIVGSDEIAAVIGGTHLRHATRERLDFTIDTIRKHRVGCFVATHCTGFESAAYLKHALPDIFSAGFAGMTLEFE